jgi:protein tyrosine phosphatase type 4A
MESIDKTFTHINYGGLNIFIAETPNDSNISIFIKNLIKLNITHVVRLCGPAYNPSPILRAGIYFHDWEFEDGSYPTQELINKWNQLIKLNEPVLVHCVAGLGRAPVLATISIIEKKMDQTDAIALMRSKRPQSLNSKQIEWLLEYKPRKTSLIKKIFGIK